MVAIPEGGIQECYIRKVVPVRLETPPINVLTDPIPATYSTHGPFFILPSQVKEDIPPSVTYASIRDNLMYAAARREADLREETTFARGKRRTHNISVKDPKLNRHIAQVTWELAPTEDETVPLILTLEARMMDKELARKVVADGKVGLVDIFKYRLTEERNVLLNYQLLGAFNGH